MVGLDDPLRAIREATGEVRLNSCPNPSRGRSRAGNVPPVTDPTPPSPTRPRRRSPVLALAVVAIPLALIAAAALFASSSGEEEGATATTDSVIGRPDQPVGGGTAAPAPTDHGGGSGTDGSPGGEGGSTSPGDDQEVPSSPGEAGPEGERTTVTYPQPTVPEGGCTRVGGTAVIVLRDAPSPACLRLRADQPVVVENRTGRNLSLVAIGVNETIAAGSEARLGSAGDAFGEGESTFWSPGNPKLSGIVQVS